MFRSVWIFLWVIAASVPLAAASEQLEFYEKCSSLQQTMLATRTRVQQWQAAQEEARRAVQVGPWYSAVLGSGEQLDALDVSRQGASAAANPATGGPQWNRFEPSWNPWATDGFAGIFSVEPLPADYLATTIHADQPVTLTFELSRYEWFGGFAYRPPASGAGVAGFGCAHLAQRPASGTAQQVGRLRARAGRQTPQLARAIRLA